MEKNFQVFLFRLRSVKGVLLVERYACEEHTEEG